MRSCPWRRWPWTSQGGKFAPFSPAKISRWIFRCIWGIKEKIHHKKRIRHNRMVRIFGESLKRWLCVGKSRKSKVVFFFTNWRCGPTKTPLRLKGVVFWAGLTFAALHKWLGFRWRRLLNGLSSHTLLMSRPPNPDLYQPFIRSGPKSWYSNQKTSQKYLVSLQWVVFLTLRVAFFGHPTPMHLAPRSGNRPVCPLQRPRWCPTSGWWKKGGNGDWLQVRRFFNMWRR